MAFTLITKDMMLKGALDQDTDSQDTTVSTPADVVEIVSRGIYIYFKLQARAFI